MQFKVSLHSTKIILNTFIHKILRFYYGLNTFIRTSLTDGNDRKFTYGEIRFSRKNIINRGNGFKSDR